MLMNNKTLLILTVFAFSSLFFLSGCCPSNPIPPDQNNSVHIRGTITEISPSQVGSDTLGFLFIEGSLYPDTSYDKAQVRITNSTIILKYSSQWNTDLTMEPTPFKELQVGMMVEVTFTGAVAESYPVQATAKKVVILDIFAL